MDDASCLETVRAELPRRLRAVHDSEVAYFGSSAEVEEVRIRAIDVGHHDDGLPELRVTCTVHDGGDGSLLAKDVARYRFDEEWREANPDHLGRIARDLHRGIGLDGRQQPTDPDVLAAASADLPDAATLWAQLASGPGCTPAGPGEVRLHGTTVLVTAEQWGDLVVDHEVAARADRGIDAARAGQGPAMAEAELEEIVASKGPTYVVWWRGDLHPSSRRELPPL